MRLRVGKWWTTLCLVALAAGCDTDEGEGGAGGGGQIDGGGGGMGGNAGEGGAGGNAGEGGEGGVGGDPQGPCAQLDEASCAARPDCVAQADVFGEFASCFPAADAPCSLLDEARCQGREDCAWENDACFEPELTCADWSDEATCERAGCFWFNDACSDERPPMQCDQPDPASCEAAGCAWTESGCLPLCENLREVACGARNDCRWMMDHCEATPEGQPCEALGPQDCVGRVDCTWHNDACIERPAGECGGLDEVACLQRPDCEAIYGEGGDVPGGGGAGEPQPVPPPGGGFLGCQVRVFDCAQVPADACERTPGCGFDEAGNCVSLDPDGCRNLDPRACLQNPRCEYRVEEICDWDGDGIPDQGAGEVPPDQDFAAPPCEVRESCEPRPDAPPPCGDLTVDQCFERFDCMLEVDPACGGADDRAAPPADCFGEDCLIAPACQICVPRPVELSCWELDQATCFNREDCRWVDQFGGGEVPVPLPEPCDCPPDAPDCGCAQDPIPVPPPPGGFCEPVQPQGCWNFGEADCQAHPECEWVPGPVDGDPIEPCVCDDAGNCMCGGGGAPFPGGGFCQDRMIPDPCAGLDQATCGLDHDQCEWLPAPGLPCDCDPADADCVCPEGAGICVFVGNGLCQAPSPDLCVADPACEWVQDEGGCECFVGPNGEEICQCFGGGGFCQPAVRPEDDCFALAGDACLANEACMMVTCDQACPPDDADCQAQCREQDVENICFPRAFLCPDAPLDICAQLDGCQVVDPCPVQPDGVACDAEPFCAPE
jgi:hypothetical protein